MDSGARAWVGPRDIIPTSLGDRRGFRTIGWEPPWSQGGHWALLPMIIREQGPGVSSA